MKRRLVVNEQTYKALQQLGEELWMEPYVALGFVVNQYMQMRQGVAPTVASAVQYKPEQPQSYEIVKDETQPVPVVETEDYIVSRFAGLIEDF